MSTIPPGYTLAVIHSGEVIDTIDLEGADLTKYAGAQQLGDEVDAIVQRRVTEAWAEQRKADLARSYRSQGRP